MGRTSWLAVRGEEEVLERKGQGGGRARVGGRATGGEGP